MSEGKMEMSVYSDQRVELKINHIIINVINEWN